MTYTPPTAEHWIDPGLVSFAPFPGYTAPAQTGALTAPASSSAPTLPGMVEAGGPGSPVGWTSSRSPPRTFPGGSLAPSSPVGWTWDLAQWPSRFWFALFGRRR